MCENEGYSPCGLLQAASVSAVQQFGESWLLATRYPSMQPPPCGSDPEPISLSFQTLALRGIVHMALRRLHNGRWWRRRRRHNATFLCRRRSVCACAPCARTSPLVRLCARQSSMDSTRSANAIFCVARTFSPLWPSLTRSLALSRPHSRTHSPLPNCPIIAREA